MFNGKCPDVQNRIRILMCVSKYFLLKNYCMINICTFVKLYYQVCRKLAKHEYSFNRNSNIKPFYPTTCFISRVVIFNVTVLIILSRPGKVFITRLIALCIDDSFLAWEWCNFLLSNALQLSIHVECSARVFCVPLFPNYCLTFCMCCH